MVRQLLKIKYVKSVFLARDFISINKSEDGDWDVSDRFLHCDRVCFAGDDGDVICRYCGP